MKIVVFKGGIGNQLFQYSFSLRIKKQGGRVYYFDGTDNSHNGLEINKYFQCEVDRLPDKFSSVFCFIRKNLHFLLKPFIAYDKNYSESKFIYDGYWQDLRFMNPEFKPEFKLKYLSEKNSRILDEIQKSQSVSIHVRRGDYLNPDNIIRFGNICTEAYYNQAIKIIENQIESPHFFIFSNDIEWCKDNLQIFNAKYIDWNNREDSIYDMYLMSYCKGAIVANSSFSYWGARIGKTKRIVIYPQKWFNDKPSPNIFPKEWKGL